MLAKIKVRPKRAADKRRITELTVSKAKPRASAYQIWDSKQGGLALRVQPTGAKAWVVVYSRHGRSRWLTLGAADRIGLSDARTEAGKVMVAVMQGHDPAAEKKSERHAGTFADLAARYVKQHAMRKNKSWQASETLIERYVVPRWGKLQASAIARGDMKQMMSRMASTPVVANGVKAAVSAIYNWGIGEEIVTANPCKLIPNFPVKSRERVLCDSELPKFWKAFGDLDPVRGAALKMILLTGQRPGEVSAMRREHIVDGWWTMPGAPVADIWPGTKNGKSHRVWIPAAALPLVGNAATGYVFASPRGGPCAKLDDGMRQICAKLGVERATPHDLRRTFGSLVTGSGHGRDAMNRILNHSTDDKVGDVYDRHGYADEDKRVTESVAAKLMALIEGRTADNIVSMKRSARRTRTK
jgi:integrase